VQLSADSAVLEGMKLKTLLAALFVAGLAVSVAVAAPAEKGRNGKASTPVETTSASTTSGAQANGTSKGKKDGCKPNRAVVLRGTFGGAGAGGFAMNVLGGNRLGRVLKGKQVTVLVVEGTKFRKNGKAALADLVSGDRLNVLGRGCKLDSQAMTLVAKRVVAHSPSGDGQDGEKDEGTPATSTSTTSTTTTAS
jgi:hypothetical protein